MARSKKSKAAEPTDKDDTLQSAEDTLTASDDTLSDAVQDAVQEDTLSAEVETTDPETSEPSGDTLTSEDHPIEADADSVAVSDETQDSLEAALDDADSLTDQSTDTVEGETLEDDGSSDLAAKQDDDSLPGVEEVDSENAQSEPDSAPLVTPPPEVIRETIVQRKGGFGAMLFGGAIAAALGFGAAQYVDTPLPFLPPPPENPADIELRQSVTNQATSLEELSARVDETAKAIEIIDLTPLSSALAGVEDGLSGAQETLADLDAQVAGFESRLTAMEKQPLADALSPEAIAAYERELDELRTSIAAQQAALEATITPETIDELRASIAAQQEAIAAAVQPETVDALQTDLTALRDALGAQEAELSQVAKSAQTLKAEAEEQAAIAASTQALADIKVAMQSGEPFAEAVTTVETNGIAVPDALKAVAEEGVATRQGLIDDYPGLARQALDVARADGLAGEEGGGLSSFLKTQLGGRSVQPREGNSADAVLSRVEAAVRGGDLETATTEAAALPDPVRAVLDGWIAQAQQRQDALAAADALAQETM